MADSQTATPDPDSAASSFGPDDYAKLHTNNDFLALSPQYKASFLASMDPSVAALAPEHRLSFVNDMFQPKEVGAARQIKQKAETTAANATPGFGESFINQLKALNPLPSGMNPNPMVMSMLPQPPTGNFSDDLQHSYLPMVPFGGLVGGMAAGIGDQLGQSLDDADAAKQAMVNSNGTLGARAANAAPYVAKSAAHAVQATAIPAAAAIGLPEGVLPNLGLAAASQAGTATDQAVSGNPAGAAGTLAGAAAPVAAIGAGIKALKAPAAVLPEPPSTDPNAVMLTPADASGSRVGQRFEKVVRGSFPGATGFDKFDAAQAAQIKQIKSSIVNDIAQLPDNLTTEDYGNALQDLSDQHADALKQAASPMYNNIAKTTADDGVTINKQPIRELAQSELDKINKMEPVVQAHYAPMKPFLRSILGQTEDESNVNPSQDALGDQTRSRNDLIRSIFGDEAAPKPDNEMSFQHANDMRSLTGDLIRQVRTPGDPMASVPTDYVTGFFKRLNGTLYDQMDKALEESGHSDLQDQLKEANALTSANHAIWDRGNLADLVAKKPEAIPYLVDNGQLSNEDLRTLKTVINGKIPGSDKTYAQADPELYDKLIAVNMRRIFDKSTSGESLAGKMHDLKETGTLQTLLPPDKIKNMDTFADSWAKVTTPTAISSSVSRFGVGNSSLLAEMIGSLGAFASGHPIIGTVALGGAAAESSIFFIWSKIISNGESVQAFKRFADSVANHAPPSQTEAAATAVLGSIKSLPPPPKQSQQGGTTP